MKKCTLLAPISILLALPALAQVADAEAVAVETADQSDARVVVIGPEGPVVTNETAISPQEAVRDLSDNGLTGQINPVMRESDRLVREPLVVRIGIDSGSVIEAVPTAE